MAVTINGSTGIAGVDGSAGTPAIQGNDTNTGIFFPAADTVAIATGGTEAMRVNSSQNVGIGTSSPDGRLHVMTASAGSVTADADADDLTVEGSANPGISILGTGDDVCSVYFGNPGSNGQKDGGIRYFQESFATVADRRSMTFITGTLERARIDSSGNLLVGRTSGLGGGERLTAEAGGSAGLAVNRQNDDGNLVNFYQAGVNEGNISVSGSTVSYNGGHLSRWAQTTTAKDESLVKGTVLSNLDEMNVYTDAEGNPIQNEQLNKVKVSDVEGDANVAGVFVNWTHDDAHNVDEINMAMTGDMIIRIAQGVTVARGDLLMSAGDGTAKPQGDDIVRSKTVAKVTSTHVTCTYADGSFCVPCVLMAC
jgi:hypothetical protein